MVQEVLLNQRHYAYTVFDGINTYAYDYGLCGRTIMLHVVYHWNRPNSKRKANLD